MICPKYKGLAEARFRDTSSTRTLENARVSFMEDAKEMETTLSPRTTARGNAKMLRLKHVRFLEFGDVFYNFFVATCQRRLNPANSDK